MKMLRAVPASKGAARSQPALRLWRGLKNVRVPAEFARRGGTEIAMSSCTHDLAVATGFAASRTSLLFLVTARAQAFMQHGADLEFLSTAPWEREVCFPPCTYLEPTGRTQTVEVAEGERRGSYLVVEVRPHFGS